MNQIDFVKNIRVEVKQEHEKLYLLISNLDKTPCLNVQSWNTLDIELDLINKLYKKVVLSSCYEEGKTIYEDRVYKSGAFAYRNSKDFTQYLILNLSAFCTSLFRTDETKWELIRCVVRNFLIPHLGITATQIAQWNFNHNISSDEYLALHSASVENTLPSWMQLTLGNGCKQTEPVLGSGLAQKRRHTNEKIFRTD